LKAAACNPLWLVEEDATKEHRHPLGWKRPSGQGPGR
jgi:hypothetical protein